MGCLSAILGVVVFFVSLSVWSDYAVAFLVSILSALVLYLVSVAVRSPTSAGNAGLQSSAGPDLRHRLQFRNVETPREATTEPTHLEGINDAFTGEPINSALGVFQCMKCKVYYHKASLDYLRSATHGQCVSCGGRQLVQLGSGMTPGVASSYSPHVVTLSDYRLHVGRVVIFEGVAQRLHTSPSGRHCAIMFEDASYSRSMKGIVFSRYVMEVGGTAFLASLIGKTVRIRGLLERHATFGYQIVITHRRMILEID